MCTRRLNLRASAWGVRVGVLGCAAMVAVLALTGVASASGYTAYVTGSSANDVLPLSTTTNVFGTPISVGSEPSGIAITPDGQTAYVANFQDGTVTPIDLATNTPGAPIPVGVYPAEVAITPDARTAYVSTYSTGNVVPITLATNQPGAPIHVGGAPWAIAVTPDGHTVYVVSLNGSSVTPIAVATNTVGNPIPVPSSARYIAITPDGSTAWVVSNNRSGGWLTPIATATNKAGTPISTGGATNAIAITPDGKTAYVSGQSVITPISLPAGTSGTPIRVGVDTPDTIAITPDGATAYVVDGGDCTVTPVALATNTAGASIPTPGGAYCRPYGIAISPEPTSGGLTATSIACSPQNVVIGQATTTCTATVRDTDSGTPVTPTGPVTFTTDSSGTFGGSPCVLSGSAGTASCQVSYAPTAVGTGQHTLTATYEGDGVHFGGSAQTIVTVAGRASSTSVSCSPESVLAGQPTVCTAMVSDTDSGTPVTPTEPVTFTTNKRGTFSASSCALSGSGASASCQIDYTPTVVGTGQHTITASYAGDGVHTPSSGQTIVLVTPRSTTTSVVCQQTTLAVGQPTTCTATVTDTSAAPVVSPTGTVKFSGTTRDTFTGSPCALPGSGGTVSCQVSYTPTAVGYGHHHLTALYSGDLVHHTSYGQITIIVP